MFYRTVNSDPVASQTASESHRKAAKAESVVERMSFDVERLLMITEALWSMLQEQHGYTEEELQKRVMEIDMRDGTLDGKVAQGPPLPCEGCGKARPKKRQRCLYCGHISAPALFER